MSSVRSLVLPKDGYGPAPQGTTDLMLLVGARVQSVLPVGWTVSTSTTVGGSDRGVDATLELVRNEQVEVTFDFQLKQSVTRSTVLSIAAQLERFDTAERPAWLVATRYLSPQLQEELRVRGISYADATGNLYLASADPLILIADRGASSDPWRGPGRPTTNLKGLPAALLVRALADFSPPYTVPELAAAAGASLGATYRLVDYLSDEGLLTRTARGPISDVDWPELLRRWSQQAGYPDTSTTRGYLEPRGLDNLLAKLRQVPPQPRYAVSGSLAAQPYATYADPRLAIIYSDDPTRLAADLDLRPVDTGANVVVVSPRSPVVFERTTSWQGITIVAVSQTAADLLSGPGRNPAEGDYLINWMENNPDEWRHQLDR